MEEHNEFFKSLSKGIVDEIRNMKIEDNSLYKLCRAYALILINAYFSLYNSSLTGKFGSEDIARFTIEFNECAHKFSLSERNKKRLFEIINEIFFITVTDQERKALPHGFRPETDSYSKGYVGVYYCCNYIPQNVIDLIKAELFD